MTRFVFLLLSSLALVSARSFPQSWEQLTGEAEQLMQTQKLDSALIVGQQALSASVKAEGLPDSVLALLLHRVGSYRRQVGSFAPAESAYSQALTIRERVLAPFDPDIASTLADLAFVCLRLSQTERAESLLTRSLHIREVVFGARSKEVASILGLLGLTSSYLGHPDIAEGRYVQALTIFEQVLGPDNLESASILDNMWILFYITDNLPRAELAASKALAIRERLLGPLANEVAETLNKLGLVHTDLRRFEKAEQELRRAISIQEKLFGAEYFRLVNPVNNLGRLLVEMGKNEAAIEQYSRARSLAAKRLGSGSIAALIASTNLATVLTGTKRFKEAETLLTETMENARKSNESDVSVDYNIIGGMADLRCAEGCFAASDSLFQRILTIHSPDHQNTASALMRYSRMLREEGNYLASWEMAHKGFLVRTKNFFEDSYGLSERAQLNYTTFISNAANDALSSFACLPHGTPIQRAQCAEVVFSAKGINTEVVSSRSANTPDSAKELQRRMRKVKEDLAKLYVQSDLPSRDVAQDNLRDSLANYLDELEAELGSESSEFRLHKQNSRVQPDSLAKFLPVNSTLLEYYRFTFQQKSGRDTSRDSSRYLVVVLDHRSRLNIVDLGSADSIDQSIQAYRTSVQELSRQGLVRSKAAMAKYGSRSAKLYRMLLHPVEQFIDKTNVLLIAPDAAINLISFATLVNSDGRYLIEDHPIHYLSAGRDLIRIAGDSTATGKGLLALGDPDYDAPALERTSKSHALVTRSRPGELSPMRNLRSGCEKLSEIRVSRLMNTREEVTDVATHWIEGTSQTRVYLGASASEENFKRQAPGSKAIHLATHGYFLSGECNQTPNMKPPSWPGENPLLLSGIFLSGANLHGTDLANDEGEDGIVTSLEVSGLDLRGTDLVVLSACETGLGKVEQGEGVYGLRRAFQFAGAKTVVSSLWQVPDDETVRFMKVLYSTNAATYPHLMQQVALNRIREARMRGRFPNPLGWGAFIATGDWRIPDHAPIK